MTIFPASNVYSTWSSRRYMPGCHNGPSPCRMVVLLGLEAHVCQGPWCAQSGCARMCLDERTAVSQVRLISTLLAVLCAPAPYVAYSSVVITSFLGSFDLFESGRAELVPPLPSFCYPEFRQTTYSYCSPAKPPDVLLDAQFASI